MFCEFFDSCKFFSTPNNVADEILEEFKKTYCETAPERCARRRVAQVIGKVYIPLDLKPDEDYRVCDVIQAALSQPE